MSDWLDGPKLVAWLEAVAGDELGSGTGRAAESASRRIGDWRRGGRASVYALDAILTRLGLHLSMVPEELYVEANPRRQRRKGAA